MWRNPPSVGGSSCPGVSSPIGLGFCQSRSRFTSRQKIVDYGKSTYSTQPRKITHFTHEIVGSRFRCASGLGNPTPRKICRLASSVRRFRRICSIRLIRDSDKWELSLGWRANNVLVGARFRCARGLGNPTPRKNSPPRRSGQDAPPTEDVVGLCVKLSASDHCVRKPLINQPHRDNITQMSTISVGRGSCLDKY